LGLWVKDSSIYQFVDNIVFGGFREVIQDIEFGHLFVGTLDYIFDALITYFLLEA
jgi:hypothetical protein